MPSEDVSDYDKIILALQKRFQLTEQGYKIKFRTSRPERGETPTQFVARLSEYFHRWIELSKINKDYKELVDLLLREQFIVSCSMELSTYLKEHRCSSIDHMAELAEAYTEAHGLQSFKSGERRNPRLSRNEKPPDRNNTEISAGNSSQGKHISGSNGRRRCFLCDSPSHVASNCFKRQREDHKSSKGDQKKTTGAVEAVSERIAVHLSDIEVEASLDSAHSSHTTHCNYTEKDKSMPVIEGYINQKRVNVLRDTGSDLIIVRSDLVKPEQMINKYKECRLVDKTTRKWPMAKVKLDNPYFTGTCEVLTVDTPVYDIIVGNVPGARAADNPDPNWKLSKQVLEASAVQTRAQKLKGNIPVTPLKTAPPVGDIDPKDMEAAQREDRSIAHLWDKARRQEESQDTLGKYCFIIKGKYLMRKCKDDSSKISKSQTQLVVPQMHRNKVMKMAHDGIMAGHQGISRTTERIQQQFYWPGMVEDIKHYCRSCDVCQRTIQKGKVGKVPLGRMPLIEQPFQRVNIDLVGPIHPVSDAGNRYIVTLIDLATRYPEAKAVPNIETVTVAEALIDICSRVGIPREVLSDMGTQFTSDLMREISRLLSIKQKFCTPYHPLTSGAVERWNGTLKQMLKRMCSERPKDWDRYINALLFAYRETPNESLGFSPFEMLYGRSVRGPMAILRELWTNEQVNPDVKTTYQYVLDLKDKLKSTCEIAHQALEKASGRFKKLYDRGKRQRQLQVGDKALILLPTDHNKLLLQWKGPFTVVSRFNDCDYQLDVHGKLKSFHINLLKKYLEREQDTVGSCIFDCELEIDGVANTMTMTAELQTDGTADKVTDIISQTAVTNDKPVENCGSVESFCKTDQQNGNYGEALDLPSDMQTEYVTDVTIGEGLDLDQTKHLTGLLEKYKDVFSDVPGKTNAIECSIKLTTDKYINSKPYPIPYASRNIMQKEIDNMLHLGIIEPCNSPYSSPLILVPKKDGKLRPCVDFRKINKITVFDPQPMPHPEDLFLQLGESKYFSKIDLSKGFWQIPMADDSKDLTSFVTPDSQYRFLYMPFGMINASAVFNRLIYKLFGKIKQVVHFIDDILVHTKTWQEHLDVLEKVLGILKEASLSARPSKCYFAFKDIEFLGHFVGKGKLMVNPEILKRIQDTERPTTKKQIRSFLGLTGYYRKFVPHYAEVALPLTDLTKKGQPEKVKWDTQQESAYRSLKVYLSNPPILKLPDNSKTFVLKTDSSNVGVAAILMQEHDGVMHPIAFASRKLLSREKNYSAIELECLAIVWGIHKFELYLYGTNFDIQTDHRPLTYIQQSKGLNKRLMGWAMYLQDFRFRVVSIPGKENFGPDFLSRVPGEEYM